MTPIGFDWHEAVGERRCLKSVGASERDYRAGYVPPLERSGGTEGFEFGSLRFSPCRAQPRRVGDRRRERPLNWCFVLIGVIRELSATIMLTSANTRVVSVIIYDLKRKRRSRGNFGAGHHAAADHLCRGACREPLAGARPPRGSPHWLTTSRHAP
jgi:hypothetical protein